MYNLLSHYARTVGVFKCDAVPWGYPWDPANGIYGVVNYQYHPTAVWRSYTTTPIKQDLVAKATKSALVMDQWEQFPHQGGSNYAFVDGHISWYSQTVYGDQTGMPPFYYP